MASAPMKIHIIANPVSGGGRGGRGEQYVIIPPLALFPLTTAALYLGLLLLVRRRANRGPSPCAG